MVASVPPCFDSSTIHHPSVTTACFGSMLLYDDDDAAGCRLEREEEEAPCYHATGGEEHGHGGEVDKQQSTNEVTDLICKPT